MHAMTHLFSLSYSFVWKFCYDFVLRSSFNSKTEPAIAQYDSENEKFTWQKKILYSIVLFFYITSSERDYITQSSLRDYTVTSLRKAIRY
jgi:hypothetical protein